MQFLQSAGAPFRRSNWRPPFSGSSLHRGWLRWLPVLSRQRRPLWKLLGLEMADRKLEGSLCRMVSRGKIKIKSGENRLKRRPESVVQKQGQKREGLEFPGPARDPQGHTNRMPVAQRWELALNGAGAPGAACLWYSSQAPPVTHRFTLVGCLSHRDGSSP